MDTQTIARLMTAGLAQPTGSDDTGLYTGVILTWDESSGVNTVQVNGVPMSNLRVIQNGIGVPYQPGDTVVVVRKGSQYYIQGKIGAPGASAANQIRSASVITTVNTGTPTSYGDLPGSFGPECQNVYIGSSRRCLVLCKSLIGANSSQGQMTVQVSGASSISAASLDYHSAWFAAGVSTSAPPGSSAMTQFVLTAADGLNQGFNTFTAKYRVTLYGTGTGCQFFNRVLTVIPF